MSGNENFLAQLKAVVDPLTIFGHYVSLRKSGNRYKALCPFHSEKTPSFYAASNGMFHCFGCGTGGDVITFVMNLEKMDFRECIQLLSSRYGIPLKFASTGERKERELLLDLMRQAADFYHNLLTTHSSGKEPLEYLEKRGITKETIRKFHLGWSPNSWSALLEHFQKRDVEPSMLEKCGLVVPRQQQQGYYDRYRGRIIVPIQDIQGNIIAFGGRILEGTGEEAKYLNSPETQLYSKSNQLFGLYLSRDAIQQKKFAVLVEGYFDLIVPFQYDHSNVVASLGTSLTENQAKLLRRYTDHVVIVYDSDQAGKAAALRALPILLRENFVVDVASLPDGMDPDSFVRERGAEELEKEIRHAIRYDRLFLLNLQQKYDLHTSTGKLAASDDLYQLLDMIENPFERVNVIRKFSMILGSDPDLLHDQYRKRIRGAKPAKLQISPSLPGGVESRLLQVFLLDLSIAKEVLPEFKEEDFQELSRADLFRYLNQVISEEEIASTAEVVSRYPAEVQKVLTSLIMDEEAAAPDVENARTWLRAIREARRDRSLRQLNQEIERAQKEGNEEKLAELLSYKQELGRELKGIKSS